MRQILIDPALKAKIVHKKRILFLSDSAGISGAEFVLLNLINRLDRQKYIPYLFYNEKNGPLRLKAEQDEIDCYASSRFPLGPQIDKRGVSLAKVKAFVRAIYGINREMRPFIRTKGIDLIHAKAYPCCLYGLLPALLSRRPLIWHVHIIRRITALNRNVYRILGFLCKRIITVSDACRDNLLSVPIRSSKIKTIYNGLDLSRFNRKGGGPDLKKEFHILPLTKVIGIIGQPLPEKGHIYFIEAAAEVVRSIPDVEFLIIGHVYVDTYHQTLIRRIEKLKMKDKITFTGWIEDIPTALKSLNILVHARFTPEPAALVLMEAMAMGVPVVAFGTGGTPELILNRKTGMLIPPKDHRALAQAIVQLIQNPEKARLMGLLGRQRMEENFTLSRQLRAIEGLWDEISNR